MAGEAGIAPEVEVDVAGERTPDLKPFGDDLPAVGLHFVSELGTGLSHDLGEMEDVSPRGLGRREDGAAGARPHLRVGELELRHQAGPEGEDAAEREAA